MFDDDGLIDRIEICILYGHKKIWNILKEIWGWIWLNIGLNIINIVAVFCISCVLFFGLCFVCESETSQWEFNINALQDNLVTQGEFRGRYASRGYVDGELSYFYLRPMYIGEKVEHIPANKTYVQYSDSEHPHVEVHQSCMDVPEWLSKVFFIDWMNSKTTQYYVLVVPEGTITNAGQYEIDMK
jgi:hypothetical protein